MRIRRFNVTGLCTPEKDYMVDISSKLQYIKEKIDRGEYFTIDRARQYGKTTTLQALKVYLKEIYIVVKISFEGLGESFFSSEAQFCLGFHEIFGRGLKFSAAMEEDIEDWRCHREDMDTFLRLSDKITDFCSGREVVLLIDEVDKATNNQTFLHFLGMLRKKYLSQKAGEDCTFLSVILAGVYDVKNMKLRMEAQGYASGREENRYNSPWNIAAAFDLDMAFSVPEIGSMLYQYEKDCHTGMDVEQVAGEIRHYTEGYPFLVSRICQEIDTKGMSWDKTGVQSAVKAILMEKNTLFDDIAHNLENNQELNAFMYELLLLGKEKQYERTNSVVDLAATYGFIRNVQGKAVVDNLMFGLKMTNYFISHHAEERRGVKITGVLAEDVVQDGHFRMDYVLEKFAEHFEGVYANVKNRKFMEDNGRLVFLTYLKPLVNGRGFYHIESRTNSERRMDVVVDYGAEQFILELKKWYGAKKHEDAWEQLYQYLVEMGAEQGYLLTFDFRKEAQPEQKWVVYKGKRIFDVIV